eukprot:6469978-Amphidinium_carterae.1
MFGSQSRLPKITSPGGLGLCKHCTWPLLCTREATGHQQFTSRSMSQCPSESSRHCIDRFSVSQQEWQS